MAGEQNKPLQYFLQSVSINDKELPRSWITSSLYIEKTALTAPLLVLDAHDPAGKLVDEMGARYGATLVAELGDPTGQRGAYKETFFVTSAPASGDVVRIIAVSQDLKRLKTPSARVRLYADRQPGDVMKEFAGALTIEADAFKKAMTYHLNMGEKPSGVLRQMADDHGALVWCARGRFCMKDMAKLISTKAAFVYEANNPQAEYTISKLSNINQDAAATSGRDFQYVGYSMTDGYVAVGDKSKPVKYISDADVTTLTNMARVLVPKLDIEVSGNADITAGMVIGVQIHRYDPDNQVDETLPKNFIVAAVIHHEDRIGYTTRMILGVPNS
ncbi:tail length tape measure protein [Enterobacter sp. BRE11]|nr:tail length tape measure protein [Enterobacter sp. BRE11]